MKQVSLNYLCTVIFFSLLVYMNSLLATSRIREVPKVTDEIENFFDKENLDFYVNYIHELIKGCRVVEHNPDMIRMCTRRRLNRNFKNMSDQVANFIIKSCDYDDASVESYGDMYSTCLQRLKRDIAQGLLPREIPAEQLIPVNPEEQAAKDAESFLKNDMDFFIENRLDDIIKYCYAKYDNTMLIKSCTYARLPHKEFISKNCRIRDLLNHDFSTSKELKAEVITCLNMLREQLDSNPLAAEAIEDVLSN